MLEGVCRWYGEQQRVAAFGKLEIKTVEEVFSAVDLDNLAYLATKCGGIYSASNPAERGAALGGVYLTRQGRKDEFDG